MLLKEEINEINNLNEYLEAIQKKLGVLSEFVLNSVLIADDNDIDEEPQCSLIPYSDYNSDRLLFKAKIGNWKLNIVCEPTFYYIESEEVGELPIKIPFNYSIVDRTKGIELVLKGLQHTVPSMTYDVVDNFISLLHETCILYRLTNSAYNRFKGTDNINIIYELIDKTIELNKNLIVKFRIRRNNYVDLTKLYIKARNFSPKLLRGFLRLINGRFEYDINMGTMVKFHLW